MDKYFLRVHNKQDSASLKIAAGVIAEIKQVLAEAAVQRCYSK